jgi:hypothetical protein
MNDDAAPAHDCPGIRIHAIDIVHPPAIAIPPIADIELHQTIVTVALAANNNAATARNARSEIARAQIARSKLPEVKSVIFNTDPAASTRTS